ncbi:hypothetical protein H112_02318 [Trichophyton rubrum D6]|uniref:rRNA adenine N(6)-methyltransferase n=2 Tax=Trichophyton TaxID=5550 RepID=F2SUD3_TRIRC|nr:uncharacterized protein TERG_06082 [Trichophyton rubrum CBS 118892]EZF25332.1 hypothetical protein H100_02318 [Trichophyton rubrum MR850]EZF44396.1 hypothetical protein H102_02314 [Trichophyton rubrum CBS 100081]EZF65676.1 hypothetical protein H104_02301 [Trichophyton rubrum CBS 289.86]EZF76270.1 hypothetical protein H105_02336 [Trichophyton soudanense CBS 452.61]EZF86958.1 hypothetical protein H110_02322 [Trichophyton rubrum MR1448]EZF97752.1 hypothetical protein H113_02328 [Trichophyton 
MFQWVSTAILFRPPPAIRLTPAMLWTKGVSFSSIPPRWVLLRSYARSASSSTSPSIRDIKDSRIHITSSELCNDVLERLAPTLPNDKPVDIIDSYPGLGIWSSHFHEYVRPRRHILLEPNFRTYEAHLKPLLQSPGSRYVHVPLDPALDRTFSDLFKKGYLPEQTERTEGSTEVNDTLLVLANMTLLRSATKLRATDSRKYFESMLDQSYFHRYGLVRIIAIFPSSNLDAILPKSISRRRRTQALLECVASEANEVAGDTSETTHLTRRGLPVVQSSAERAAKRNEGVVVKVPPGREPIPLELAPKPVVVNGAQHSYVPRPIHDWHHEYIRAHRDLKKEEQKIDTTNPIPAKLKDLRKTFAALQKRYLYESSQIRSAHEADDRQCDIDNIEADLRKVMNGTLPVPSRRKAGKIIKNLALLKEERDIILSSLGKQFIRHHYPLFVNERRCVAGSQSSPSVEPLLLWDKRAYEPLHVEKHEFSPKTPCSIVDIRPNPNSYIFDAQRQYKAANESFKYISVLTTFRALLRMFIPYPKKSIEQVLRLLFASRPMADFPSAIPSLAEYATPKITVDAKEAASWKHVKTNNRRGVFVGYDMDCLAEATLQRIPSKLFWDIAVEWERWRHEKNLPDTLSKSLGGAFISDMNEAFEARR